METAILVPVIEIRANTITYYKPQTIVKRDIAGVKHAMDVFAK